MWISFSAFVNLCHFSLNLFVDCNLFISNYETIRTPYCLAVFSTPPLTATCYSCRHESDLQLNTLKIYS